MWNVRVDPKHPQPLYEQLQDAVRRAIRAGRMKPGERLPSIREVSKKTGLAYMTVLRSFRNLTQEGLLTSRVGSGTRVAPTAAAKQRTRCIGLVGATSLSEMRRSSPYFSAVFMSIQDEIIERTYSSAYDRWLPSRSIHSLFQKLSLVDGLVVFRLDVNENRPVDDLAQGTLPVLCVGCSSVDDAVSNVDSENETDTRDAISALVKDGHRRIAFATHEMGRETSRLRLKGFHEAVRQHGLNPAHCPVFETMGSELGRNVARQKPYPTALFIAGGIQAFPAALPVLKRAGISVGKDLYLCAYDDDYWRTLGGLGFPYSRIRQSVSELARTAARTILDLVEGKEKGPLQIRLRSRIERIVPDAKG